MRNPLRLALAAIATTAALAFASAAASAVLYATYTGTVTGGRDITGQFGEANTDLAGSGFKAVFTLSLKSPQTGNSGWR